VKSGEGTGVSQELLPPSSVSKSELIYQPEVASSRQYGGGSIFLRNVD
jgi:hypothetical protein